MLNTWNELLSAIKQYKSGGLWVFSGTYFISKTPPILFSYLIGTTQKVTACYFDNDSLYCQRR